MGCSAGCTLMSRSPGRPLTAPTDLRPDLTCDEGESGRPAGRRIWPAGDRPAGGRTSFLVFPNPTRLQVRPRRARPPGTLPAGPARSSVPAAVPARDRPPGGGVPAGRHRRWQGAANTRTGGDPGHDSRGRFEGAAGRVGVSVGSRPVRPGHGIITTPMIRTIRIIRRISGKQLRF
jgi:hypothetical protein